MVEGTRLNVEDGNNEEAKHLLRYSCILCRFNLKVLQAEKKNDAEDQAEK